MSYCDFNSKLFKEFISMKKKIKPQMTDDWTIDTSSYNFNDGFGLTSKKLGQTIQDIDLRRFLQFCGEQDLNIQGLKLIGNFVVGKDRSVYTEEMYNEWKAKFDKRAENLIEKKDLEVGYEYKTICGASFVFLGEFYQVNLNKKATERKQYVNIVDWDFVNKSTKNKKIYLIKWDSSWKSIQPFPSNRKISSKLDKKPLSKETIDGYVNEYKIGDDGKRVVHETSLKNLNLAFEEYPVKDENSNIKRKEYITRRSIPFFKLPDDDRVYMVHKEITKRTRKRERPYSYSYHRRDEYHDSYERLSLKSKGSPYIITDEYTSVVEVTIEDNKLKIGDNIVRVNKGDKISKIVGFKHVSK